MFHFAFTFLFSESFNLYLLFNPHCPFAPLRGGKGMGDKTRVRARARPNLRKTKLTLDASPLITAVIKGISPGASPRFVLSTGLRHNTSYKHLRYYQRSYHGTLLTTVQH